MTTPHYAVEHHYHQRRHFGTILCPGERATIYAQLWNIANSAQPHHTITIDPITIDEIDIGDCSCKPHPPCPACDERGKAACDGWGSCENTDGLSE